MKFYFFLIEFCAKWFGRAAHGFIGQVRKYSGVSYYTHTEKVNKIVKAHCGNAYQGAACYLHDYREDVVTKLEADGRWFWLNVFEFFYWVLFPARVHKLVNELTDEFTSENYPEQNRKWRKAQEANRISRISDEAKTIKLADLYDNTESIVNDDPKFAITYLKEKAVVMKGLHGGNRELYGIVKKQLDDGIIKLDVKIETAYEIHSSNTVSK